MKGPSALLAAAVCVLAAASALQAAPQDAGSVTSGLTHVAGFDRITTEKFNYNLNTGTFSIPVRFVATRGSTDISADRATGNSKQKQMHAEGRVVVHQTEAAVPDPAAGKASGLTERPSTLTCDKLDVDGNRKLYTATGNMHFTQEGGREASSDTAVLDEPNHRLHMEGHVHVKSGDQTLDADVLDYDTLSGELIGNGNVTIVTPVENPAPNASPGPGKTKKRKISI